MHSYTTQEFITIEQKIGSMIMMGFPGTNVQDENIQKVHSYIQKGTLGGIILFKHNISAPEQLIKLTSSLYNIRNDCFIAVDQEGGKVQRLGQDNGFKNFPSAKEVAQTQSPSEAHETYLELSKLLKDFYINLNFAPVVDIDDEDKPCPVIGGLNRSFSSKPEIVITYATECIKAHHKNGILTAIKHFPGHGLATSDTHVGMVDATQTSKEEELVPFHKLMELTQAVMTAHTVNKKLDSQGYPATLSSIIIQQQLRNRGGQKVVVISDDLCMGAIVQHYPFKERVILAINAGCDLLVFSNNPLAWKNTVDCSIDLDIPDKVIQVVKKAMETGEIRQEVIEQAYQRIESLRQQIKRCI